ncbi:MAG: ABC transporter ATP-binding protein [Anaerolineae bacterium]
MAVKLAVSGISKVYQIPILEKIEFDVEEGEFVCILGPNGCGKTTLLRIIAGLDPPSSGQVRLDGRAVSYTGNWNRHIGFVFQEDRLLPWLTLEDNVALVLKPLGVGPRERRQTARRYLQFVGLHGFEQYYPSRVSGGMRQRAAIARALAIEPDLLLMDEPFGGLDPQNRRIMQAEVRRIWAETRKTILFVTHSIEEAVAIGTALIMISARPGSVREIARNDGSQDALKLATRLDTMIMEEVLRQQGTPVDRWGATTRTTHPQGGQA